MPRTLALTGPAAAALWGLDGFRDRDWPPLWCAPIRSQPAPSIIRTWRWLPPEEVAGVLVAPIPTVLRHLATTRLGPPAVELDLIELAVECSLRSGALELAELTAPSGNRGDQLLRSVLRRRPNGEPPTESYAETRAAQLFRRLKLRAWRQIPIIGRRRYRADFMLPVRASRRPEVFRPDLGLIVEIDSREFHEQHFEEDHRRESTYDELGYRWVSFTPNQIEFDEAQVRRVISRAMSGIAARRNLKSPGRVKG